MCGRYALSLRPSQIRRMLEEDDMPVDDAPEDEGQGAPRQTYNFAPGYHGVVYRADVSDRGSNHNRGHEGLDPDQATDGTSSGQPGTGGSSVKYRLQSMQWGLIPFWTKRDPGYAMLSKTINCRDDSLSTSGGMWSTMKAGKRCVVVAQGFFEWLKTGRDKLPHFVKRKDGQLMYFAGLWDCVKYEDADEKRYTYTIITTDSNKQLKFLHDRMPVILDAGSNEIKMWLDPKRRGWSKDLQDILKPFEGDLVCYPVTKDVGKVGNNSPSFLIPVASKENKSNIANFFANVPAKQESKLPDVKTTAEAEEESNKSPTGKLLPVPETVTMSVKVSEGEAKGGVKRQVPDAEAVDEPSTKRPFPVKSRQSKISATRNGVRDPAKSKSKSKSDGTPKITKFFANIP